MSFRKYASSFSETRFLQRRTWTSPNWHESTAALLLLVRPLEFVGLACESCVCHVLGLPFMSSTESAELAHRLGEWGNMYCYLSLRVASSLCVPVFISAEIHQIHPSVWHHLRESDTAGSRARYKLGHGELCVPIHWSNLELRHRSFHVSRTRKLERNAAAVSRTTCSCTMDHVIGTSSCYGSTTTSPTSPKCIRSSGRSRCHVDFVTVGLFFFVCIANAFVSCASCLRPSYSVSTLSRTRS